MSVRSRVFAIVCDLCHREDDWIQFSDVVAQWIREGGRRKSAEFVVTMALGLLRKRGLVEAQELNDTSFWRVPRITKG